MADERRSDRGRERFKPGPGEKKEHSGYREAHARDPERGGGAVPKGSAQPPAQRREEERDAAPIEEPAKAGGETRRQQMARGVAHEDAGAHDGDSPQPKRRATGKKKPFQPQERDPGSSPPTRGGGVPRVAAGAEDVGVEEFQHALEDVIGRDPDGPTVLQMSVRAVVVYLAALLMIKTGAKRFVGRNAALDIVAAFVLGSVVSRAITGNAPFVPTLAAGFVLVLVHRVIAVAAFRSRAVEGFVKGHTERLVEDGRVDRALAKKSQVTDEDLAEGCRLHRIERVEDAKGVWLERSGSFSAVPKEASE